MDAKDEAAFQNALAQLEADGVITRDGNQITLTGKDMKHALTLQKHKGEHRGKTH